MSTDPRPRSSNAGILLLVLFAGYEVAQAVTQHDLTYLFGSWLALTAALVLAMRMPGTRVEFTRRGHLRAGLVTAEVSWLALAVVAGVVALAAGRSSTWVWAAAGLLGALLTPLAVSVAAGPAV